MVTAHELREITRNYELTQLLDKLKATAKTGECTYDVDYLEYDQWKQLERLGFEIHWHEYSDRRTISW